MDPLTTTPITPPMELPRTLEPPPPAAPPAAPAANTPKRPPRSRASKPACPLCEELELPQLTPEQRAELEAEAARSTDRLKAQAFEMFDLVGGELQHFQRVNTRATAAVAIACAMIRSNTAGEDVHVCAVTLADKILAEVDRTAPARPTRTPTTTAAPAAKPAAPDTPSV